MKAIPTTYNGVRFRSRTEARWAVLFDMVAREYCVSMPWVYEKEGFYLPSGMYLPDFWLPTVDGGTWVEIKGEPPTPQETRLCNELGEATGKRVVLFYGDMPPGADKNEGGFLLSPGGDNFYELCFCCWCGGPSFQFEGRGGRVHDTPSCSMELPTAPSAPPWFPKTYRVCRHGGDKCRNPVAPQIYDCAVKFRFWDPPRLDPPRLVYP